VRGRFGNGWGWNLLGGLIKVLTPNNIYLGDCLDLMPQIPDKSVDMILTDPPYNIARDNNFASMGRAGIDFGEWDKNADIFSYIKECFRVLSKNGSFVVFNAWKNLGDIVKIAERHGFITKDMIRLEKSNPMPRNRDRRYITDFECAIWFTMPGAKWIFNRQDLNYQRPKFIHSIDKGLHPTQKSLKLMENLVKIHSNQDQVILDCFMGSGTTCLAAKNLNRQFIGIEKEEKYFDIAKTRLGL
jgi:site-specific DNA-methyltransferase (adenine-specific)